MYDAIIKCIVRSYISKAT